MLSVLFPYMKSEPMRAILFAGIWANRGRSFPKLGQIFPVHEIVANVWNMTKQVQIFSLLSAFHFYFPFKYHTMLPAGILGVLYGS